MRTYVVRRLFLFVPTLFIMSVIIFVVLRILPGDPAVIILGETEYTQQDLEDLRERLGLTGPLVGQYLGWIRDTVTFDLGYSLRNDTLIATELTDRLPVTLELALLSVVLAWPVGIAIGVLSAVRQDRPEDYALRGTALLGLTLPSFWVGTLIVLILSRYFNWLPQLRYEQFWVDPIGNLSQMIWPALAIATYSSAVIVRITRAQMLEVMRQDYIRTARAKGLAEWGVLVRHALKNASLPIITITGVQFGYLLGGSVIMENIFSLPGIGKLYVEGIFARDYPVVQVITVVFTVMFLVINLLVDLLYGWLDPRIRYD